MKIIVLPLLFSLLFSCVSRDTKVGSASADPTSGSVAPGDTAEHQGDVRTAAGPALTDFSCDITASQVPETMHLGQPPVKIHVKVTNRSTKGEAWPAFLPGRSSRQAVSIASYWILGKAQTEGDHFPLAADLQPGQSAELDIAIKSPKTAGDYELRVEPLQEDVTWFDLKGGCNQRINVKVTR